MRGIMAPLGKRKKNVVRDGCGTSRKNGALCLYRRTYDTFEIRQQGKVLKLPYEFLYKNHRLIKVRIMDLFFTINSMEASMSIYK